MSTSDDSNLCSNLGCKNDRHEGRELCIECIAFLPGHVLKCARGGCDNLKHASSDFCRPCLAASESRPAARHVCDNLPTISG